MTKFLKSVSLVGVCLIALGALLALSGFMSGGYRYLSQTQNGFNLIGWGWNGQTWGSFSSTNTNAALEAFHSIEVTGPLLDLDLEPSHDGNYALALDCSKDMPQPSYRVEKGTLYVESKWPKKWNLGIQDHSYHATILYPAGTVFDSVSINTRACDLSANDFQSRKTDFNVDIGDVDISGASLGQFQFLSNMGDLKIEDSTASNASVILRMGDFDGEGFDTDGFTVDVNMGNVDISGAFRGKTEVGIDMGEVSLEPTLPKDQYYVELKGMARNDTLGSSDGPNEIYVHVPMGESHVSFHD